MWNLNRLTQTQILDILRLLHNPRVQQEIYTNYAHPLRNYMPFLDQPTLQAQFFHGYARQIASIDPNLYKLRIYV